MVSSCADRPYCSDAPANHKQRFSQITNATLRSLIGLITIQFLKSILGNHIVVWIACVLTLCKTFDASIRVSPPFFSSQPLRTTARWCVLSRPRGVAAASNETAGIAGTETAGAATEPAAAGGGGVGTTGPPCGMGIAGGAGGGAADAPSSKVNSTARRWAQRCSSPIMAALPAVCVKTDLSQSQDSRKTVEIDGISHRNAVDGDDARP